MNEREAGRPAALGALLKLAWRFGNARERLFVAQIYLVVPVVILLIWALAVDEGTRPMLDYIGGNVVVWGFQIGFFQQAFLRPIYTPAAYRELARRGYGPGSPTRYSELARYLDARGFYGHLPGEVALGLLYWAAFYGLLFVGFVLGYVLGRLTGFWSILIYAMVVTPVGLWLWIVYRRRVSRFYSEMESLHYGVRDATAERSPAGRAGHRYD